MAYTPNTDFLALLRQTSGGVRSENVPGLDYVTAVLARAGMINLSVGQSPPTSSQSTTAWFKPAQPSWSAEGQLYLWNSITAEYELATPALWQKTTAFSPYVFQSAAVASNIITVGTSLLAVQRAAPTATALQLPNLAAQYASGRRLQIVDFSTSVVNHVITLTTPDGTTIMQKPNWSLLSTAVQLAGVALQPSPDLNAWIIAP